MHNNQAISIVGNQVMLNYDPVDKFPVIRPDKYISLYVNGVFPQAN